MNNKSEKELENSDDFIMIENQDLIIDDSLSLAKQDENLDSSSRSPINTKSEAVTINGINYGDVNLEKCRGDGLKNSITSAKVLEADKTSHVTEIESRENISNNAFSRGLEIDDNFKQKTEIMVLSSEDSNMTENRMLSIDNAQKPNRDYIDNTDRLKNIKVFTEPHKILSCFPRNFINSENDLEMAKEVNYAGNIKKSCEDIISERSTVPIQNCRTEANHSDIKNRACGVERNFSETNKNVRLDKHDRSNTNGMDFKNWNLDERNKYKNNVSVFPLPNVSNHINEMEEKQYPVVDRTLEVLIKDHNKIISSAKEGCNENNFTNVDSGAKSKIKNIQLDEENSNKSVTELITFYEGLTSSVKKQSSKRILNQKKKTKSFECEQKANEDNLLKGNQTTTKNGAISSASETQISKISSEKSGRQISIEKTPEFIIPKLTEILQLPILQSKRSSFSVGNCAHLKNTKKCSEGDGKRIKEIILDFSHVVLQKKDTSSISISERIRSRFTNENAKLINTISIKKLGNLRIIDNEDINSNMSMIRKCVDCFGNDTNSTIREPNSTDIDKNEFSLIQNQIKEQKNKQDYIFKGKNTPVSSGKDPDVKGFIGIVFAITIFAVICKVIS